MISNRAIILSGGWEGHQPIETSLFLKEILDENGITAVIYDDPDILINWKHVENTRLLISQWTDRTLTDKQLEAVVKLIGGGTGLAGNHAGLCSSFNSNIDWSFITGAFFVAHPGGNSVDFKVKIENKNSPITEGIEDFNILTEQYYLLIDPGINVLATSEFSGKNLSEPNNENSCLKIFLMLDEGNHGIWNSAHEANRYGPHYQNLPVTMPVVWTKHFGSGRVFGCTLGHNLEIFQKEPVKNLTLNGLKWAAKMV